METNFELEKDILRKKEKDKEKTLIENQYKQSLLNYVQMHCTKGTFSPNTYNLFTEIIASHDADFGKKARI